MSKFYGTVEGNRGMATRCGSLDSGIRTSAQSWKGSVVVHMYENKNGELMVRIGTPDGSTPHMGWGGREWCGTFEGFRDLLRSA